MRGRLAYEPTNGNRDSGKLSQRITKSQSDDGGMGGEKYILSMLRIRQDRAFDFFCPYCQEEYELKSKAGAIGGVIADGAYDTMISRIKGDTGVPGTWILQKSIILVVICVFRRKNY